MCHGANYPENSKRRGVSACGTNEHNAKKSVFLLLFSGWKLRRRRRNNFRRVLSSMEKRIKIQKSFNSNDLDFWYSQKLMSELSSQEKTPFSRALRKRCRIRPSGRTGAKRNCRRNKTSNVQTFAYTTRNSLPRILRGDGLQKHSKVLKYTRKHSQNSRFQRKKKVKGDFKP